MGNKWVKIEKPREKSKKKKDREQKVNTKQDKINKQNKNQMMRDSDKEEQSRNEHDVKEFLSDETILKATAKALNLFHQTRIKKITLHQANVCVVCDWYIIGTEPVKR